MPEAKKHILVVDDDTRLRSLLQRYLRSRDFWFPRQKMLRKPKAF